MVWWPGEWIGFSSLRLEERSEQIEWTFPVIWHSAGLTAKSMPITEKGGGGEREKEKEKEMNVYAKEDILKTGI